MDAKNSEMPRTADALAGLTEALSRLGAGIAAKKNELAEKDKTLAGQLEKKRLRYCFAERIFRQGYRTNRRHHRKIRQHTGKQWLR